VTTWFAATVARVSPMAVAMVPAATSSGPAAAWMALATTKVSLIVVEFILVATRVLR